MHGSGGPRPKAVDIMFAISVVCQSAEPICDCDGARIPAACSVTVASSILSSWPLFLATLGASKFSRRDEHCTFGVRRPTKRSPHPLLFYGHLKP